MSVDDLRGWVRALTEPVDRDAVRVIFHAVGPEGFEQTVADAVDGQEDPADRATGLATALEQIGDDLRFDKPPHWMRIANAIIDIGWGSDPEDEGLGRALSLASVFGPSRSL